MLRGRVYGSKMLKFQQTLSWNFWFGIRLSQTIGNISIDIVMLLVKIVAAVVVANQWRRNAIGRYCAGYVRG